MSRITHSLVGYDRHTERIAAEFDVPDEVIFRAKELARVTADDPDAVMCYALDAQRAQELAAILQASIDTERCDYFLEGFAAAEVPYIFAEDAEFRLDSLEYSAWIHNDADKDHVKVTVRRQTLDDYASKHGHKSHRAVVGLLNANIKTEVEEMVNRGIDGGRATGGRLELTSRDLGAILDG